MRCTRYVHVLYQGFRSAVVVLTLTLVKHLESVVTPKVLEPCEYPKNRDEINNSAGTRTLSFPT